MDRELVISVLNVVQTSTDKSVVYKCLLKLRTDLVKDRDGIKLFLSANGISPMVRLLNKPHEKILEVVLSILGNCCTDQACCNEALDNKIYLPLTTILKSIPNPVIQCRACRLLGNLAKSNITQLLSTHCPAISQAMCKIIELTTDVQTRIMAFRACRFLLANAQFLKYFLQGNGFTQMLRIFASVMKNHDVAQDAQDFSELTPSLGLKRNQHREKYFEEVARNLEGVRSDIFDHEVLKNSCRNSNEYALPKEAAALDMAYEILKCLLTMSALQINIRIWEFIARQSCTFSPLVHFVTRDNKQRSVALKILSNFSKNPGAFYMLSNADAIFAACELLVTVDMTKPLTESELRHCINIICMLSTDACNRSKIRRSGALRKLITMIRESDSQSERSSILYILNNFQYDNMSMELMLREGLITVLIRELNDYLTCDDEHHKRKREERLQSCKKRKITETLVEPICKYAKTSDLALLDMDSPSSSPRSCQSPASPCSSRSMSPVGLSPFQDNDADDDNYSPACSDEEASDEEDSTQTVTLNCSANNENVDIMKLLDIGTETIDDGISDKDDVDETSQDLPQVKPYQMTNILRGTIEIIENLIFRITLMINKRVELGKPEIFDTLIKAINMFGANNNFANALTNILLESQFFAQIIKQGIAHQLYQMTKVSEMRKDGFGFLETLTNVGESNYGKAELVRLLRSDDLLSQKRAAVSVAYIIKNYRLLYQFLNDGNALTLLFEMLLTSQIDELTAEAADAITSMSLYTLLIKPPDIEKLEEFLHCTDTVNEQLTLHDVCDMRFVVPAAGGGSDAPPVTIGFNKQLLCDTSEVFKTMLNSNFREGNEGEIQMQQYTASGLRYFLNLIVRQSLHQKYNVPPAGKFHALLEAFEMSRIYLIPVMENALEKLLVQLLDAANCLRLLEWALKNYHEELTETAINFYLYSTLNTTEKVALFREAEDSKHSATWFQLINNAVYERCRNGI